MSHWSHFPLEAAVDEVDPVSGDDVVVVVAVDLAAADEAKPAAVDVAVVAFAVAAAFVDVAAADACRMVVAVVGSSVDAAAALDEAAPIPVEVVPMGDSFCHSTQINNSD